MNAPTSGGPPLLRPLATEHGLSRRPRSGGSSAARRPTAGYSALLVVGLAACGGTDGGLPVADDSGNADLLVEWTLPEAGAEVARNEKITIVFRHAVLPHTLTVELGGVPVPLATMDDREFRFVPLPLHEAGAEIEVRVLAGVEDVQGQVLDQDVSWSFLTDPVAIEELSAPSLSADEIALIESGDAATPMDLVTDYDDPDSSLFDISPPIDPASPHLALLVDRLLTSVLHHGGIGLAAPQVGINRRIFVADVDGAPRAFINPTLLGWGESWGGVLEGCLSVPDRDANVQRPHSIEYAYTRPDGMPVDQENLEDTSLFVYPARVWLHEFDHLNGILMVDRETLPPEP